jgi:hypothetical protein
MKALPVKGPPVLAHVRTTRSHFPLALVGIRQLQVTTTNPEAPE